MFLIYLSCLKFFAKFYHLMQDVDLDGEDRIMEDYYNTVKVKTEPTNETMVS